MNGWDELLYYKKDGDYTIDNMLAERAIRPFSVNRKNSMFYSSEEGVEIASLYFSIIDTVKMCGLEVKEYLIYVLR